MRQHVLATILITCAAGQSMAGNIDTVAGNGKPGYAGDGGKATAALLNQPFHCDLDGKGHLFIAEADNHCVRRIDLKTGISHDRRRHREEGLHRRWRSGDQGDLQRTLRRRRHTGRRSLHGGSA